MSTYLAVDLGASNGRVMVAEIGEGVRLREVHRFANRPVRAAGTLYWDILALYQGILDGLAKAGDGVVSIGVDSWAVDYGLLDENGRLLGNPVCYRDGRVEGIMERVIGEIGADTLYQTGGVQFLPFNTVYQLLADRLAGAATMLMIPDLLVHWLTGSIGAEVTNASTTGLYDVRRREWAWPLIDRLGIPRRIFPELRVPGTPAGVLREDLGLGPVPVTAVASHDTASAVAAVPADTSHFAYISCGTWSLVGVELPAPVLSREGRLANFTNEAGVDGTTRYLRNVMGLWILTECLRVWGNPDLGELLDAARRAPAFAAVINPDDPSFLPPGDMPARIAAFCERTGQTPPPDRAGIVRCVLESLALAHRRAVRDAVRLSGHGVDVIHIVGGGARNRLLCELTADACGLPVLAGPVEAAALGNALVQARARGEVGGLADLRALARRAETIMTYLPSRGAGGWDDAETRLHPE